MNAKLAIIAIPDQNLQRQKIMQAILFSARKEITVRKEPTRKFVAQLELSAIPPAYAATMNAYRV